MDHCGSIGQNVMSISVFTSTPDDQGREVSETLDTNCIFTWFIMLENLIAYSHCESYEFCQCIMNIPEIEQNPHAPDVNLLGIRLVRCVKNLRCLVVWGSNVCIHPCAWSQNLGHPKVCHLYKSLRCLGC